MSKVQQHEWTDAQYEAYALGMQTEREHQNALSRLAARKHQEELERATAGAQGGSVTLAELAALAFVVNAAGLRTATRDDKLFDALDVARKAITRLSDDYIARHVGTQGEGNDANP